jgi:long-chain acyl-CoA synthetase
MHQSLAQLIVEARRRWPEQVALVDRGERLTYRELFDRVTSCAAALAEHGVRQGDRVAMMIPNTADFPTLYYAVLCLGATVVPILPLLSAAEVTHILRDTRARLLIADAEASNPALAASAATSTTLIMVGSASKDDAVETMELRVPSHRPGADIVTAEPGDLAVIMYTSGTTGVPKGAMLTHANLVWNAVISARDVVSLSERDRVFGSAPLSHSNGQTVVMNSAVCAGAAVVLMRRFDAREALELIVREQVSVFVGVPTMYTALVEAARADHRRRELRLRLAVSGAAPLPTALVDEFRAIFGAEIYEGYGLTESSPVATFSQPVFGRRAGSVGHPLWGLDVEVARPDPAERIELLAAGEVGEVVVRGHAVFAGYLNNPEATAAAITDGWLRTGDLGTKDDDGFLQIVGRKKEMILRGGYNVYPREVEEVLAAHAGIAQAAVVGAPDPYYGEEVHAFVVLHGGADVPSEAEIIEWSRARLARYKYPRHVHFRDSLPLGPSGKVSKRELAHELARAVD